MRGLCRNSLIALLLMSPGVRAQEGGPDETPAQDALAAEESLARFDELLRRRPFHDSAFDALVSHFVEQGKLEDLVAGYEARAEALPDETALRVILARLLVRAGDPERAAEVLEGLDSSEFGRDEIKLLVLWSRVEGARGDLDRGRALIEQAIEKAETISEQLELSEALADLQLRANDREAAAAALMAALDRLPNEYLHAKRIADALVQRGLDDAAIDAYNRILPLVAGRPDRRVEVLRQLGMAYERLGATEPALQAYAEAIDLLGEGHWLQRELSERIVSLYRAGGKLDELEEYCRGRIERSPSQVSTRVLLSEVQEAREDVDGARATLELAVELFPDDQSLSERLIALLERTDAIEAAHAEHERIIAKRPDDPELYIAYGQFLIRHEQVEAARRQWRHVLESEVSDASMAMRLASLFEPREMYEDAVTCYERAIQLSPDQAQGYVSLSRLWLLRGDEEQARDALDRLAAANPNDGALHAERSRGLQSLGDLDAALDALSQACSLEPANVRYMEDRADLLTRLGRAEEALIVRRDAIDIMTNPVARARAISGLVSMHAGADRLDELEQAGLDHLDAEPASELGMLILATIADQQRDFPTSREWLERLLEAHPTHEAARTQIARLNEATGDIDAAVEAYRTLIEQHPGRARQYYQAIVDARLRHNDRFAAVKTLEQLVAANPENVTVLDSVAEQLARMDEIERALDIYQRALRLQPDRHETRLAYGEVLEQNGQLQEAVEELRVAAMQTVDRETSARALGKLHETAGQLGQLEELLDDLERQVEANPDRTLIAALAAQLLVEEYEYARAIRLLDLVLRANPRDVNMHVARASLLRRLARFDDAIETYQRVLRFPQVDRDYVLGELGKTAFEAGRVEQARRVWRQIDHKQYAGSLLANNSLLDDAIDVLRDGVRFKPDDDALHRALIKVLEDAGREDEALAASRRLLDLQPDNAQHVQDVALKYLRRGDRAGAAQIAGRLFSAGVEQTSQQTPQAPGWQSYAAMWSMYGGGYGQGGQSKLDMAVQFFIENGLLSELKVVLADQLASQPDNAVLHRRAVDLYAEELGDPRRSLDLLRKLETMSFPLEHQVWLGQSSQRDYMRAMAYQLVASRPALRDERLVALEAEGELGLDRQVELAMIRQGQGDTEAAITMLKAVVVENPDDLLAGSALAESLLSLERFEEATTVVAALAEKLEAQQEAMLDQTVERVRRDYVRNLPLPLQARIDEPMRREIARKLLRGQALLADWSSTGQLMGAYRARLALAQIYAETEQFDKAREIWRALAPTAAADADGWATLAGVVQEYEQDDLAFEFYTQALTASRRMSGDPLLQRVYGGSNQIRRWYSDEEGIDNSFNRLLRSFAENDSLVELYDFLREDGQTVRAKQIARQYELDERLIESYGTRVADARAEFLTNVDSPLQASVPYFAEVCKLTEILDRQGRWDEAEAEFIAYLEDFPDEVKLLTMLSDVAEAGAKLDEAIEWQHLAVEAQRRLSSQSRTWAMRQLAFQPAIPEVLSSKIDEWTWAQRWGFGGWWSSTQTVDAAESWLRIARLHLANKNPIAAGDAMTRALREARGNRQRIATAILSMIRERQLIDDMLPVLRTLAVREPTNEAAQLAFAESLESSGRQDVALEVYRRLLRRGVTDLNTLTKVRTRLTALAPDDESIQGESLETLEETVASNPNDAGEKLRLAKAYYYSLRPLDALAMLDDVQRLAPHLEEAVDLRIEIYTLLNQTDDLIAALEAQVAKAGDERRQMARRKLVKQLLIAGRAEEAIEELKQLVDPSDPSSYQRVGMMLHYFGRHEEAIEQFELAAGSQQGGARMSWQGDQGSASIARAYALEGDVDKAIDKVLEVIEAAAQQETSQTGIYAMFGGGEESKFEQFVSLFVLEPAIGEGVEQRLLERRRDNPQDVATSRLLIDLFKRSGRGDQAQLLLDELAGEGGGDQHLVQMLIDRAIAEEDFDRAIELAKSFIDRHPKPVIPAGLPADYAAMMSLMSERNTMICKLGDVYWQIGDADQAFETYEQIVDEKVDASRLAYASICIVRGRVDEARDIVETSLAAQEIRSPQLLQFRALIAALDDDADLVFDLLAEADQVETDDAMMGFGGDSSTLISVAQAAGLQDRYFDHLRSKIEATPGDWSLRQTLAMAQQQAGRFDEAIATLDEAARQQPMRLQALSLKSQWLEPMMSDEAKIESIRERIELTEQQVGAADSRYAMYGGSSSNSSHLRTELGQLLWDLGRRDEAVETWMERADESSASTYTGFGARYMKEGEWQLARESYERALELSPTNSIVHHQLARLAIRDGETAAAIDHLIEVYRAESHAGVISRNRELTLSIDSKHALATLLVDTGEVDSVIADLDHDRRADAQLMMAIWTGRWGDADRLVTERLAESPFDPTLWRLRSRCKEQLGDVEDSLHALYALNRLRETTLTDHHEQLQLALAGKQVQEAAGQQTQPGATGAQGMYSSYSGYYPYGRGEADDATQRLASLHIRLGQFEEAERLFLAQSVNTTTLPSIAHLMWKQGERARAIELLRLATITGEDTTNIAQYADMLAETGKVDEAVDLLLRNYRYASGVDRRYYSYYGYSDAASELTLETGDESQITRSMSVMLDRSRQLDHTIDRFREHLGADPDDRTLLRLTVSLLLRHERWDEARDLLRTQLDRGDSDPAFANTLLTLSIQLRRPEEALDALDALADVLSEREMLQRRALAFLILEDADQARTAILESIEAAGEEDIRVELLMLIATGAFDEVSNRIGDTEEHMDIVMVLPPESSRWAEVAEFVLDRIWSSPAPFEPANEWIQRLASIVRAADDAGAPLTMDDDVDSALVQLIAGDAEAAVERLTSLRADRPADLRVLRVLHLGAAITGDHALMRDTLESIVVWLTDNRGAVWRAAEPENIGANAQAALRSLAGSDVDTQSILNMSVGYGASILNQVLESQSNEAPIRLTTELLTPHVIKLRETLANSGDVASLEAAMKLEVEDSSNDWRMRQYYASLGYNPYGSRNPPQSTVESLLVDAGRYDDYLQLVTPDDARLDHDDWLSYAKAMAATGRMDEGVRYRDRAGRATLSTMREEDRPSVTGSTTYWWSFLYQAEQELRAVASQLDQVMVAIDPDDPTFDDGADEPWEIAHVSEAVAELLQEVEANIGPGWGGTTTLRQVLSFLWTRERYDELLDLLDRVYEGPEITRSDYLSWYLIAAARVDDHARFERVLDDAADAGDALRDDTDLLRLCYLRHKGDDADADALEAALIGASQDPHADLIALDPVLRARIADAPRLQESQVYRGGRWVRTENVSSALSLQGLARAIGVTVTNQGGGEAMTLARIRSAYAAFGLYEDAIRMADLQLETQPPPPEFRLRIDMLKCAWLHRLERHVEAEALAASLLAEHLDRSEPLMELESLVEFAGDKMGANDPLKALEILRTLKAGNPLVDADGLAEAGYLAHADRAQEAWRLYSRCIDMGDIPYDDAEVLYEAGLVAAAAGDDAMSRRLLASAVWLDPTHRLSDKAREGLK